MGSFSKIIIRDLGRQIEETREDVLYKPQVQAVA